MSKTAKRSTVMSIIHAYSGKDNVIAIPRIYVQMCGDYNRAAVLNQILYWSERTDDKDGWFWKSYSEWESELGLTRYQIKRAVEGDKRSKDNSQALASMGVEFKLKQAPNGAPTIHYRIDEETFIKALTTAIDAFKPAPKDNEISMLNNVANGVGNIVENASVTMSHMDVEQCSSSFNTEITTENTTKKKEKDARATTEIIQFNAFDIYKLGTVKQRKYNDGSAVEVLIGGQFHKECIAIFEAWTAALKKHNQLGDWPLERLWQNNLDEIKMLAYAKRTPEQIRAYVLSKYEQGDKWHKVNSKTVSLENVITNIPAFVEAQDKLEASKVDVVSDIAPTPAAEMFDPFAEHEQKESA